MKKKFDDTPSNQAQLAHYRAELIRRATPAEKHIHFLLTEMGERFMFQKGFFCFRRFVIVDFYLPKRRRLCLEIDGEYHNFVKDHDAERDQFLRDVRGFRVVRLTNQDAMMQSVHTLKRFIQ